MALELPQTKRTRRPSVRLGEIGELGFTASWLDSRSSRKLQQLQEREQKQQEQVHEQEQEEEHEHKRESEHEHEEEHEHEHQEEQEDHHLEEQDEEQEEEWSVVEVAVGGASPVVVAPASTPIGKRRSGGGRVRRTGSKARGRPDEDVPAARSEPPLGKRLDPEDDEGLFRTAMSSDSDVRGLTELPGPRFGGGGAHPNSHGDEMQGAIEDGPDGRGFRTGVRRSGRPGARRKHRIASRETVSRDTSAEEPVVAQIANGTIVVTPSSRSGELQRITLSAGVSGWLQELGLGKYAELFELNEVDTEVLPLLTLDDLREMGVEAVGARRKMFTNIEALRGV